MAKAEKYIKIRFHLEYNVLPTLTEKTVKDIIETLKRFESGELSLGDEIVKDSKVTVADLLEDMKLESLFSDAIDRDLFWEEHRGDLCEGLNLN